MSIRSFDPICILALMDPSKWLVLCRSRQSTIEVARLAFYILGERMEQADALVRGDRFTHFQCQVMTRQSYAVQNLLFQQFPNLRRFSEHTDFSCVPRDSQIACIHSICGTSRLVVAVPQTLQSLLDIGRAASQECALLQKLAVPFVGEWPGSSFREFIDPTCVALRRFARLEPLSFRELDDRALL